MNVAAFVISMFGALFSMMQGGCVMVVGNLTSNLGEQLNDAETQNMGMDASLGGFFVFISSIIAIIGGSLALKRRTSGWKNLLVAGLICYYVGNETTFKDGHVWCGVYLLAAFFALLSAKRSINLLQSSIGCKTVANPTSLDDILDKNNPDDNSMGILQLIRISQYFSCFRDYKILVDGFEIGKIGNGSTSKIALKAGTHVIQAKIDWCSTKPFEFQLCPGRQTTIEVGSILCGWRLWVMTFYMYFLPSHVLYLRTLE